MAYIVKNHYSGKVVATMPTFEEAKAYCLEVSRSRNCGIYRTWTEGDAVMIDAGPVVFNITEVAE